MRKKLLSKFDSWFKAQFGQLPQELRTYEEIMEDLSDAKRNLAVLEHELEWMERLAAEYRAASYARNAAKDDFKF